MAHKPATPTQVEHKLGRDEIIVSKTDLKGHITYANSVFLRIAQFSEAEVLGAPHSLIRHPDMPRAVFKLLWDTIEAGHEIFAYVKNLCKNGDFYWVFAHVTPTRDASGKVIGYHSNRRSVEPSAIAEISALYEVLLKEEHSHKSRKNGLVASHQMLVDQLSGAGVTYDEFIFDLTERALAA